MTAATPPRPDPSLDLPLYGASWSQAMRRFFLKYATFRGRASRSEFWWWVLTAVVASAVLRTLSDLATGVGGDRDIFNPVSITDPWGAVEAVLQLALLVPALAVSCRRLHDIDRSGAWILFVFVPLAGPIVYLVMTCTGPRPSGARFDA